MAYISSEVEFANKFGKLIGFVCSEPVYNDDYQQYSTGDLKDIPSFALPKLKHTVKFKRNNVSTGSSKEIKVVFKSLRPPKFNKTMSIESNLLIHNVKNLLITELSSQDGIVLKISQVKLMLKTKTIPDSEIIGNLVDSENDEISLNVMITKDTTSTPEPTVVSEIQNNDPEPMSVDEVEFKGLSTESWSKIYDILKTEIKDGDKRDKYFNSLKSVSI